MSRKVLTTPYIVWGAAFIILPLFMVLYYGCTGSDGSFTLSNITAMADSVHYKAFWNSVWIALASTLICLVVSYPLAYILSSFPVPVLLFSVLPVSLSLPPSSVILSRPLFHISAFCIPLFHISAFSYFIYFAHPADNTDCIFHYNLKLLP